MGNLNQTANFGFYLVMFWIFFSTLLKKALLILLRSSSFWASSEANRNFKSIIILSLLTEATKILRIWLFTCQPCHYIKKCIFLKKRHQRKKRIIGGKLWNAYLHKLITLERDRALNEDCASSFRCCLSSESLAWHPEEPSWGCGAPAVWARVTGERSGQGRRCGLSWEQQQHGAATPCLQHQHHNTEGLRWLPKFDAVEKQRDSGGWDSTFCPVQGLGAPAFLPSSLPVITFPALSSLSPSNPQPDRAWLSPPSPNLQKFQYS